MIDYSKVATAIQLYETLGYTYVEVPWVVSPCAIHATRPKSDRRRFDLTDGTILVGSAEQGFLQMMLEKRLPVGKYVAASPCFRDESAVSALTRPWFFKVELYDSRDSASPVNTFEHAQHVFAELGVDTRPYGTDEGWDLVDVKYQIELGSYGYRNFLDRMFVYGTGLAEPRFSLVKNGLWSSPNDAQENYR